MCISLYIFSVYVYVICIHIYIYIGYGTALGVIRRLHELNALEHVYACETRPYNQGARLTSFEIVHDKLPGTLIPDSAASALMAVKGVDVVIVGGDRVTVNGGKWALMYSKRRSWCMQLVYSRLYVYIIVCLYNNSSIVVYIYHLLYK